MTNNVLITDMVRDENSNEENLIQTVYQILCESMLKQQADEIFMTDSEMQLAYNLTEKVQLFYLSRFFLTQLNILSFKYNQNFENQRICLTSQTKEEWLVGFKRIILPLLIDTRAPVPVI